MFIDYFSDNKKDGFNDQDFYKVVSEAEYP